MKYDFNYVKTKLLLLPKEGYTAWQEGVITEDVALDEANLLTSKHRGNNCKCPECNRHRVVLDIDHDAALIPSSTPGHFHLIIDVNMPWLNYTNLLRALADAGVIEQGYCHASIKNGFTAIRTPWERKNSL